MAFNHKRSIFFRLFLALVTAGLIVLAASCGRYTGQAPIISNHVYIPLIAYQAYIPKVQVPTVQKKLIEFGWDEPSTAFMRQHIVEMERNSPFDGCVFHVTGDFTWKVWGARTFTYAEVEQGIKDLQATQFRSFTDNFLRFNVTPGDVDWFDDFSAIVNNAKLAGRVAKEGGVKGIFFDTEMYEAKLWDYDSQIYTSQKSYEEYKLQARQRGREVMQAFQYYYPNITIFLTYGYVMSDSKSSHEFLPSQFLANVASGYNRTLIHPFLDGMLDIINPQATIIDGGEGAYFAINQEHFAHFYIERTQAALSFVSNPTKYLSVFSFGHGTYIDAHPISSWHTDKNDFEKNYFSPDKLKIAVFNSLQTSDNYSWVYSETPRWWTDTGLRDELPDEYYWAVLKGKVTALGPLPPDEERPIVSEVKLSISQDGRKVISAKITDPQKQEDIKQVIADYMPPLDLAEEIQLIELNDSGTNGDASAGDGIYSAFLSNGDNSDTTIAVMAGDSEGHWNMETFSSH